MMIHLRLRDRPAVVLGGGRVAQRRVEALVGAGAVVTVISPTATEGLERLAHAGQIRVEHRRYRPGDLRGVRVACAATGDVEANRLARIEADAEGVWLNVADEPSLCDFFMPAVVRRGHLTVGISTDGVSPIFAARLRQKLEGELDGEHASVLEALAAVRARCRREGRPLAEAREEIEALIARAFRSGS